MHARADVLHDRATPGRLTCTEVRDALAEAVDAEGLSLAGYVRRELEHLAWRSQRVRDNAAVVRRTQNQVGGHVDLAVILSALHEGRGD